MPWFDKLKKKDDEEIPAELQGKSAKEIADALKEAADLKSKVTTLEADRQKEKEQVTVLSSQFDQVKARLAAAEANLNKRDNPPKNEEPIDWNIDPEGAFKQNIAPLVNVTVANAAQSAKLLTIQSLDNEDSVSPPEAKTMNGRLFRAWESEINEEAKKYPLSQMGTTSSWVAIYYLVKGRHSDELANPETRKKKYNFLESAAKVPAPQDTKPKDGVESLTDAEKHVADKMHVKYEDYAKRKKDMQFIGA